jgi:chromosome segregation ATPase
MTTFVAFCAVIIVGAAGFVLLAFGGIPVSLVDAFASLPPPQRTAWYALAFAFVALLPTAMWLSDRLTKQRQANKTLQIQLGSVRQSIDTREKTQADAESKVNYLVRTDPEERVASLQQRITEADRFAHVQQSRNQVGDLNSRVDDIRNQQLALKERLDKVVEDRKAVEQLFMELDRNQSDIERTLSDVEGGEDGNDLDMHMRKLADFIKATHYRFEQIERSLSTLLQNKSDFQALQARLAPLESENGGIKSLIRELNGLGDKLSSEIGELEKGPDGGLVECVKMLGDRKGEIADQVASINEQFGKLSTVRREIVGLFGNLGRALNALSQIEGDATGSNLDARVREVTQFINETQGRFSQINRAMEEFAQMKKEIEGLQTRLVPLESDETGVRNSINELRERRDQLAARIVRLERDDESALTDRVKSFTESKRELEARVTVLNDEFTKLATIRKDIGALLAKLSGTIGASLS